MKIKQEMREETKQNDKIKPFARFKEAMERHSKVAIAAFAVTFAVACGPDSPGQDSGPDGGVDAQTDGGTTDTGTDSGNPTGLCAQYGPGHANRITLTLGQEIRVGTEECESKMVFLGIVGEGPGNKATLGNYAPPQTYPLGSCDLIEGEQTSVFFKGAGWTVIEPCEISAHPCEINPATHTTSGDTGCTVTVAADRAWIVP